MIEIYKGPVFRAWIPTVGKRSGRRPSLIVFHWLCRGAAWVECIY